MWLSNNSPISHKCHCEQFSIELFYSEEFDIDFFKQHKQNSIQCYWTEVAAEISKMDISKLQQKLHYTTTQITICILETTRDRYGQNISK